MAVAAVRLVARGAIVPTLRTNRRSDGRTVDLRVRWAPAHVDRAEVDELAAAMPGPVTVLGRADARVVTLDVLGAVVDAIATDAAGRLELPAPPPVIRTAAAAAEAVITRLDGSAFPAPVGGGGRGVQAARPLVQARVTASAATGWSSSSTRPTRGDAWFLSVLGPGAEGGLLPVEVALADSEGRQALADELARLERILPAAPAGRRPAPRPGGARARTRRGSS